MGERKGMRRGREKRGGEEEMGRREEGGEGDTITRIGLRR